MRDDSRRSEAGFTLIELLIALMLSAVLVGAISTGFGVALNAWQGTHERFIQTHDNQMLATYFTSDVQSAHPALVDPVVDTDPTTPTGCQASPADAEDNVLRLQWTETTTGSPTAFAVSYRVRPSASGDQLVRYQCAGGDLSTVSPTPDVVAHKLSGAPAATVDPATGRIALALSTISDPSPYAFTFSASMRTPSGVPPIGSPAFLVSAAGPQVAGSPFGVTITATTDGSTTDATYTGSKALAFAGPGSSPNGTIPIYPTSVNFSGGVGTASIALFKAESASLAVTDSAASLAGAASITVATASVPLSFSACPPNTKKGTSTVETIVRDSADAYGNPDPLGSVAVNLSATNAGTFSPASVTIPAGDTTSPSVIYTNPPANNKAVVMTGAATGYANATCSFTTTIN